MSFGCTKLILTILSALAQDESRSISDNIRWSIQKKFQRGEAMVDLSRMLGYDKGENGEWVINRSRQRLFDTFLNAMCAVYPQLHRQGTQCDGEENSAGQHLEGRRSAVYPPK